jgi:hypothetical protein
MKSLILSFDRLNQLTQETASKVLIHRGAFLEELSSLPTFDRVSLNHQKVFDQLVSALAQSHTDPWRNKTASVDPDAPRKGVYRYHPSIRVMRFLAKKTSKVASLSSKMSALLKLPLPYQDEELRSMLWVELIPYLNPAQRLTLREYARAHLKSPFLKLEIAARLDSGYFNRVELESAVGSPNIEMHKPAPKREAEEDDASESTESTDDDNRPLKSLRKSLE